MNDNDSLGSEIYPQDVTPFENQVAGHSLENGKSTLGLLKNKDGYILKPLVKQVQGAREKNFYSNLMQATDSESLELQSFVPEYLGTTVLNVDGKNVEFLILKNITEDFSEPCVMDVKIGKQTWDPESSQEKRDHEDKKYTETKRDLGFCIPGFQVYNISTGNLTKMEKDFGKTLTKHTTKDALKLFLNAESGLCRRLILSLLAHLWRILRWCRTQRNYHFYSSSLLLVYDAKRLRKSLKIDSNSTIRHQSSDLSTANYSNESTCDPISPSKVMEHPHRSLSRTNSRSGSSSPVTQPSTPPLQYQKLGTFVLDSWHATLDKVCLSRTHSFVNNYEKDLESMKDDYSFQLDDLMRSDKPGDKEMWTAVKMIDFAHVFPAPSDEEDSNYLEGIENLVKMLEDLMLEAI